MSNIVKDLKELPKVFEKNDPNTASIMALLNRAVQALEVLAMAAESIDQRLAGVEPQKEKAGSKDVLDFFTDVPEFEEFLRQVISSKRMLGEQKISSLEICKVLRRVKKVEESVKIQISYKMTPSLCERLKLSPLPGPNGSVASWEILPA